MGTFRNSNGLFVQGKYRPIYMMLINIGLSIVFAILMGDKGNNPIGGMFGVKIATAISQIVTLQWFDPYLVYKNVFKKKISTYFATVLSQLAFTAVCCAGVYFIGKLLENTGINHYVMFVIRMVLCLIIPNLLIIAVFHKKTEFKDFVLILRNIISRRKNKKSESKPVQTTSE